MELTNDSMEGIRFFFFRISIAPLIGAGHFTLLSLHDQHQAQFHSHIHCWIESQRNLWLKYLKTLWLSNQGIG